MKQTLKWSYHAAKNLLKKLRFKGSANLKIEKKVFSGARYIYDHQDASDVIARQLEKDSPCLISRYGTTELSVVEHFVRHKGKWSCNFPDGLKNNISTLSGFFPVTDNILCRFCCDFLSCCKSIDVLGVRCRENEREFYGIEDPFISEYSSNAQLIDVCSLSPFEKGVVPWMHVLREKKVLVIHPFEKTIQQQYENRKNLFENASQFLPDFDLKVIRAVQSLEGAGERSRYRTWYDALKEMCDKIDAVDFDIALIGAGAYGMFMGKHIKDRGKKAVHVGGALQLFFGIRGQRWDESERVSKFYNSSWVYPGTQDEYPGFRRVEGGCYYAGK